MRVRDDRPIVCVNHQRKESVENKFFIYHGFLFFQRKTGGGEGKSRKDGRKDEKRHQRQFDKRRVANREIRGGRNCKKNKRKREWEREATMMMANDEKSFLSRNQLQTFKDVMQEKKEWVRKTGHSYTWFVADDVSKELLGCDSTLSLSRPPSSYLVGLKPMLTRKTTLCVEEGKKMCLSI